MNDYTYLEDILLPARFFQKISGIDMENARLIERRNQMEQIAIDAERSAVLMTKKRVFSRGLREKDFSGFCKANEISLERAGENKFTKDYVVEIHKTIMTGDVRGGTYRQSEWNEDAHRVYQVKPEDIECILQEICDAYQAVAENKNIHPLLLIACVLQDLILLAPFEEGNMLVAELVARSLLLGNGYEIVRYRPCRLEEKDSYVVHLAEAAIDAREAEKGIVPFMEHLLFQLADAYRKLESQMIAVKETRILKKERIEAVVLGSCAPITKAEICERLPDVSETTIEAQLAVLCKKGQITRLGTRRNSVYVKRNVEE